VHSRSERAIRKLQRKRSLRSMTGGQTRTLFPCRGHDWPSSLLPASVPQPIPHPTHFNLEDGSSVYAAHVCIYLQDHAAPQSRTPQPFFFFPFPASCNLQRNIVGLTLSPTFCPSHTWGHIILRAGNLTEEKSCVFNDTSVMAILVPISAGNRI
jgi:hypothetical protein